MNKEIHKSKDGKRTVCSRNLKDVLWTDRNKFVDCERCKNIGGK